MKRIYLILFASLFLWGCANRGVGPQGGPKDSIPPVPVKSVPENGALEFKGKRIDVTFNENLQLDNISQNLLMSPPQQRAPEVKARGKHLVVLFTDTLQDSTTYTLDFGDAVRRDEATDRRRRAFDREERCAGSDIERCGRESCAIEIQSSFSNLDFAVEIVIVCLLLPCARPSLADYAASVGGERGRGRRTGTGRGRNRHLHAVACRIAFAAARYDDAVDCAVFVENGVCRRVRPDAARYRHLRRRHVT